MCIVIIKTSDCSELFLSLTSTRETSSWHLHQHSCKCRPLTDTCLCHMGDILKLCFFPSNVQVSNLLSADSITVDRLPAKRGRGRGVGQRNESLSFSLDICQSMAAPVRGWWIIIHRGGFDGQHAAAYCLEITTYISLRLRVARDRETGWHNNAICDRALLLAKWVSN